MHLEGDRTMGFAAGLLLGGRSLGACDLEGFTSLPSPSLDSLCLLDARRSAAFLCQALYHATSPWSWPTMQGLKLLTPKLK